MTGFNLPPGCNVSDIPGNRPEDELADAIAEGWRPRCGDCGGFLTIKPTRFDVELGEDDIGNYDQKTGEWHERHVEFPVTIAVWVCRSCGAERKEPW